MIGTHTPPPHRPRWLAIFAMFIAVVTPIVSTAFAQDRPVRASAAVESPTVYVGDRVQFLITVENARNVDAPTIPSSPDYSIEFLTSQDQSSSFTTIINGQVSQNSQVKTVLIYAVTPHHAGTMTIPAVEVVVAGQKHRTNAVTFQVAEPKRSADTFLTLTAERTRCFVGQPIKVTLTWYLNKRIRSFSPALPFDTTAFDVYDAPDPRPQNAVPNDERFINAELIGGDGEVHRVIAVVGRGVYNNQPMTTVTIQRILVPRRPSDPAKALALGPARITYDAIIGERPRDFLDTFLEDRSITQRELAVATPLSLTVEALPDLGRPDNFSGLVGKYTISAAAKTTDPAVGDPIDLTITVTGPAPLSLVPPIDLSRQLDDAGAFRLPLDPILPTVTETQARFDTSIRARSETIAAIPSINFSYFDPDTRTYTIARSAPMPLKVRPSTNVGLPYEPVDTAPDGTPRAAAFSDENRPGGIAPIVEELPRSGRTTVDPASLLRSPAAMVVAVLPVLIYAGTALFVGWRTRRLRHPASLRARSALRRARRTLRGRASRTDSAGTASGAVCRYIADRFDLPDPSITGEEAADALRGSSESLAARLAELTRRCDAARFPAESTRLSGQANEAAVLGEAESLVCDIERHMRSRG